MLATQNSGAQKTFALSGDAEVTVDILNIAGRRVRTLATRRVTTPGTNVMVWDGCNSAAAAVPAGLYMVKLQAVARNGEVVNALRQLQINC